MGSFWNPLDLVLRSRASSLRRESCVSSCKVSTRPYSTRAHKPSKNDPRPPSADDVDKLVKNFEAATESSSTTAAELYTHLKGLQPWLASLPVESRAQQVAKHKIGSRALLFVWNNGLEKTLAFHEYLDFKSMICLWLVAEKKDSYIEQWILTTLPPDVKEAMGKAALLRRSSLWRDLINAEITLMSKKSRSGDALNERFFQIYKLRSEHVNTLGDLRAMSAWPATSDLATVLTRWNLYETSPPLFDRFAEFLRRFPGKGETPHAPCSAG